MKARDPSEIISKLQKLPSLPDKVARLEDLLNDPQSTYSDMTRVIETDLGLASQVLKLANSAYYSVIGGVQLLEKAVVYLGMTTIYQMVLCTQSQLILHNEAKMLPEYFGRHSLSVAVISKHLSERLNLALPDRAFSAGLLHDFGRVATYVLYPDLVKAYNEAIAKGAEHTISLEQEIIGIDHQRVGAELAKHWKYPSGLSWVISDHHGPGQAVMNRQEEDYRLVSDIVAVADSWSWSMDRKGLHSGVSPALASERIGRTGLPANLSAEEAGKLLMMFEQARLF
jgi:putative nucleotidyltransferase with HDIG domain